MSSKPTFRFFFDSDEYKRRQMHEFPPLSFAIGSYQESPLTKLCHSYWNYLIKKDYRNEFKKIFADRIPNYRDIIKHPIDLSIIKERLLKNQYQTMESFKSDIDLIWKNCIQFNGTNSDISIYAMKLRDDFNSLWNLHRSITDNLRNTSMQSIELEEKAVKIMNSINTELFLFPDHLLPPKPQEKSGSKRSKEKSQSKSFIDLSNEPLSNGEKEKLAKRIDNLVPALLDGIIDILVKSVPNIDLTKEVTIPFSDIPTPALREMDRYLRKKKIEESAVKKMYQQEIIPLDEQIQILESAITKFDEILKKSTVEFSSDNETDSADSSVSEETSSTDDSDS